MMWMSSDWVKSEAMVVYVDAGIVGVDLGVRWGFWAGMGDESCPYQD